MGKSRVKPNSNKENLAAGIQKAGPAKEVAAPRNPPPKGATTKEIMVVLSISQVAPQDRAKLNPKDPMVAKVVLTEHSFASLRDTTKTTENSARTKMQEIDNEMAAMGKSKEAQKLEVVVGPLRSEAEDRAKDQQKFNESIESQHEKMKDVIVQLLTDIANGNTKPSHIDPVFSQIERSIRDKQKELESLMRNNAYLLIKIQPVENRVKFQAVAYKSEKMMQAGMVAPKLE